MLTQIVIVEMQRVASPSGNEKNEINETHISRNCSFSEQFVGERCVHQRGD